MFWLKIIIKIKSLVKFSKLLIGENGRLINSYKKSIKISLIYKFLRKIICQ